MPEFVKFLFCLIVGALAVGVMVARIANWLDNWRKKRKVASA